MDNNIDIETLSKQIASNIESDQMSEESSDDFEKLKKLELLKNKINKKEKKKKKKKILDDDDDDDDDEIKQKIRNHTKKISLNNNLKSQLKEPIFVILLFIIFAHPTFEDTILSKIPLDIIQNNTIIKLIIKGLLVGILFFFLKKVIK